MLPCAGVPEAAGGGAGGTVSSHIQLNMLYKGKYVLAQPKVGMRRVIADSIEDVASAFPVGGSIKRTGLAEITVRIYSLQANKFRDLDNKLCTDFGPYMLCDPVHTTIPITDKNKALRLKAAGLAVMRTLPAVRADAKAEGVPISDDEERHPEANVQLADDRSSVTDRSHARTQRMLGGTSAPAGGSGEAPEGEATA